MTVVIEDSVCTLVMLKLNLEGEVEKTLDAMPGRSKAISNPGDCVWQERWDIWVECTEMGLRQSPKQMMNNLQPYVPSSGVWIQSWKSWMAQRLADRRVMRLSLVWEIHLGSILKLWFNRWFVVVVQFLSCMWLFATPWTVAHQASLSFIVSWGLLKFISIESVMPSNHLILFHLRLLLPSIFPSMRVFSNESALRIKWPKYWSFSFNSCPSE